MKKALPAGFAVFVVLVVAAAVQGQTYFNVKVTVIDTDDAPVPGAAVRITENGEPSQVYTGTTDQNGLAIVGVMVLGPDKSRDHHFKVTVSKPNYSVGTSDFFARDNYKQNSLQLEVTLTPGFSTEVEVEVTAQDDGRPVVGASVTLNGPGPFDSTTTDGDGRAVLHASPGSNVVRVSSGNFKREETTVTTTRSDKQKSLRFSLTRKPVDSSKAAEIRVRVVGKDDNGVLRPIRNAVVATNAVAGAYTTDADGWAIFKAEALYGDEFDVTATANGYGQGSGKVRVQANTFAGAITSLHGGVELTLVANEKKISFSIEVRDGSTNKPIVGAKVVLHPYDTSIADMKSSTDSLGVAPFSQEIPVEKALKGMRVVFKDLPGYKDEWSDIPADLMTGKERLFTVYLNPSKFADLTGTWQRAGWTEYKTLTITQTNDTIRWTQDYRWGSVMRVEDAVGTVTQTSFGTASIDVKINYTEQTGATYKGAYVGTVTVDANGKATRIEWRNGAVFVR